MKSPVLSFLFDRIQHSAVEDGGYTTVIYYSDSNKNEIIKLVSKIVCSVSGGRKKLNE